MEGNYERFKTFSLLPESNKKKTTTTLKQKHPFYNIWTLFGVNVRHFKCWQVCTDSHLTIEMWLVHFEYIPVYEKVCKLVQPHCFSCFFPLCPLRKITNICFSVMLLNSVKTFSCCVLISASVYINHKLWHTALCRLPKSWRVDEMTEIPTR